MSDPRVKERLDHIIDAIERIEWKLDQLREIVSKQRNEEEPTFHTRLRPFPLPAPLVRDSLARDIRQFFRQDENNK